MKNKIKIFLILILFMLPFNVEALTGSTELNCSKTSVTPGSTITCTLKGTSDEEVSSLSSKISVSSNLTLGDVTVDSIWEGSGDADLELYTDKNKTGTFAIATFTVNVSSSVTEGSNEEITIGSTKFFDGNYDGFDVANTTQSIKVLSTVNTLSNITLSNGTLSPTFNSNTVNYTATVDNDKVTLNATKTDEKSSINGNIGELSLKYGINTFKITVTSESGSTKDYTVSVTRPDNRSKENFLLSFGFNGYDINFDQEKTEYTIDVDNEVSRIGFCDKNTIKDNLLCINDEDTEISNKAFGDLYLGDFDLLTRYYDEIINDEIVKECDDEVCILYLGDEVVGKYGRDNSYEWYIPVHELKVGLNILKVVITSENESVRTYTFNINRKSASIEGDNSSVGDGNNNSNSSSNSSSNSNSNDSITTNPTTGSLQLYLVIAIVVISIVVGIFYFNKYQKKKVTDNV